MHLENIFTFNKNCTYTIIALYLQKKMTAQKPLYKRGVNNNLIWWGEICLEDACSYRTFSGVQGGKITESKPTKCSYKNIGRQNEVSPKQQAMKQLQALRAKKIKEGYSENEPGVFEKQQQQQKKFEPVLAETYSKFLVVTCYIISSNADMMIKGRAEKK